MSSTDSQRNLLDFFFLFSLGINQWIPSENRPPIFWKKKYPKFRFSENFLKVYFLNASNGFFMLQSLRIANEIPWKTSSWTPLENFNHFFQNWFINSGRNITRDSFTKPFKKYSKSASIKFYKIFFSGTPTWVPLDVPLKTSSHISLGIS